MPPGKGPSGLGKMAVLCYNIRISKDFYGGNKNSD